MAVVVDVTPFTFETSSKELVEVEIVRVLLLIIDDVAVRPLILVVRIFPEDDWVKELMKLTTLDAIPLIIEVKEFEVVEIELELIIVVVDTEPPMLEFNSLFEEVRELETVIEATFRLETERLVRVAFPDLISPL